MKRLLFTSVVALALTALAGSAFTADLGQGPVYKVHPIAEWTGCYIGGNVGGAWANADYTFNNGGGTIEPFSFNSRSFIGGGQVGCQFQFTPYLVLGAEGTFSATHLNQTDTSAILGNSFTRALSIDDIATLTARLGYTQDLWMIYAKGGWAGLRVNTQSASTVVGDATDWESGWTVGGGIEYMVWKNVVVGAEFNYYRVDFDRTMGVNGITTQFTNAHANTYSVLFRANYLFNFF